MAFVLLSRSRSKTQGSVKPVPKQKSARGQRPADSRFGFAKPVFQPQTAAVPAAPVIQTKLKVGEPNDEFDQGADRVAKLTETANGSILPSAAAQSRSPMESLQRLYSNQAVLQMRNGSGGPPAPSMPLRLSQGGILQRKCACGGAAGMSGECEECSKKKRLGLQTKLKVNEPGDAYEQEADRIADQVMATPAHPGVSGAPLRIQRFSGQSTGQINAAPASVDQALASPGRPLEQALRQDMEQRFGHDFSRVRVHSGAAAEQSARDVNAHAYTVGHNIVFGTGQFAPGTHQGQWLIAHELTHVLQQSCPEPAVQRQEPKNTGEETWAALIPSQHKMVQRSPDDEESCAINQTILVYQGKLGQELCITEDDPEFRQNYIDNNIVLATGLAIPGTTWANIDHDRIPQMKLTYKDGRTLVVDVKDIPLQLYARTRRPQTVSAFRPLARYEKRDDGFIYPIRSAAGKDYVSYGDASNIMSLRRGLHAQIEDLKDLFTLIELGAAFASNIAALGSIAGLNQAFKTGGLFEPVSKRKTRAPAAVSEEPGSAKTSRAAKPEAEPETAKPLPAAVSARASKTILAETPAKGRHTVRIKKGGVVEVCSEPCANIGLVFRETLNQNPPLSKSFKSIKARAQQAEEMIASGDAKLVAKGEKLAKEAAADAVRLQTSLAETGIRRGGTRYRPEPDLLGEGRHGLGWKDSDATARAKRTGKPQGKFGGVEDIQYAVDLAAQLGPGNHGTFPLPAGNRSHVFMPNGTVRPATQVFVLVRQNGSVHAYPL